MMAGRTLTTPKGEELIVLGREEYEDLVAQLHHDMTGKGKNNTDYTNWIGGVNP